MTSPEDPHRGIEHEVADLQTIQSLLDTVALATTPTTFKERYRQKVDQVVYSTKTRRKIIITDDGTRYACRYFPEGADKDKGERRMATDNELSAPTQGLMAAIAVIPDFSSTVPLAENSGMYYEIIRNPKTKLLTIESKLLVPVSLNNGDTAGMAFVSDLLTPEERKQRTMEDIVFARAVGASLVTKGEISSLIRGLTSVSQPTPRRRI